MANEEQLSILKQGVEVWNKWREEEFEFEIDLERADLTGADLRHADLHGANLSLTFLNAANLRKVDLAFANLSGSVLTDANLSGAELSKANLSGVGLRRANLFGVKLIEANLKRADLIEANLSGANLWGANFFEAEVGGTVFGNLDVSKVIGLEDIFHIGPSSISTDTFALSKGKIPEVFLRGSGLSDLEIEELKFYQPNLSNEEINEILYRIYDLRATQALQISPLFLSYGHSDNTFVDKLESQLNQKGIRFWRDKHDATSGRLEKVIDRAIRQNPTVLLVLSKHSLSSDWVEHEVRTARGLEKETGRDVLCPIALDDSWKDSKWEKHVMEQVMKYNILDFSAWQDDSKFDGMFRKLIDGLELFYKG